MGVQTMKTTITKLSELKRTNTFNIKEGERVILSDPKYKLDYAKIGANHILNAKSGSWTYSFNKETKTLDIYELNSSSLVKEKGINNLIFDEIDDLPVNSGQVGVFIENSYKNDSLIEHIILEDDTYDHIDEKWYRACCEITNSKDDMGFIPNGFVTTTRYINGVYAYGIKYAPETKEVAYIRICTTDLCICCGSEEECSCIVCDGCDYEISNCCCEICNVCGKKEHECCCECEFCDECECDYCHECGELLQFCFCTKDDDEQ